MRSTATVGAPGVAPRPTSGRRRPRLTRAGRRGGRTVGRSFGSDAVGARVDDEGSADGVVLGDQLRRDLGALAGVAPGEVTVLMVESTAKLASKRWHRQRAHMVLSAMRHFAAELPDEGFDVDLRRAPNLPAGLADHRREHRPETVVAMEPASWDGWRMLERHDVELVRSDQFVCHPDEFAEWAGGRGQTRMEDFYRWQRRRLDLLMDGDEPAGGRWNFDADNRQPPPTGEHSWPRPRVHRPDDIDREVAAELAELELDLLDHGEL